MIMGLFVMLTQTQNDCNMLNKFKTKSN